TWPSRSPTSTRPWRGRPARATDWSAASASTRAHGAWRTSADPRGSSPPSPNRSGDGLVATATAGLARPKPLPQSLESQKDPRDGPADHEEDAERAGRETEDLLPPPGNVLEHLGCAVVHDSDDLHARSDFPFVA